MKGIIKLKTKATTLDEVSVYAYMTSGIRSNIDDLSLEVHVDDLALLPGETDGDLFQALDALPGIASPDSASIHESICVCQDDMS